MGIRVLLLLTGVAFLSLLTTTVDAQSPRQREGVDVPLQITTHKQEITDGQFVLYAYQVVLSRDADDIGGAHNLNILEQATFTRQQLFTAFMAGQEFFTTPGLNNDTNYIRRLYQYLLKRPNPPTATEIQIHLTTLQNWMASGKSREQAWYDLFNAFISLPEYGNANCTTQGWSYGRQLRDGAPSLEDLFSGKARFQNTSEGQRINLNFQGTTVDPWDQKLPIIFHNNSYIGFTRGFLGSEAHPDLDVFMLYSNDGINFGQATRIFTGRADVGIPQDVTGQISLYDPHISTDYSYCPMRYSMTMECDGRLCMSESSTPWLKWAWSKPKLVVDGGLVSGGPFNNRWLSASTGTTIVDKTGKRYVYWTAIDNGENYPFQPIDDDGDESASVRGAFMGSLNVPAFADAGSSLMTAESNTNCTSSWDCNNKDNQDMKYEGEKYYSIYNGANYYGCIQAANDTGTNDWALSVARSTSPLGNFDTNRLGKLVDSTLKDMCGISYPVVNEIDGELYLYYSHHITKRIINHTKRSKLVYIADINQDGKADIADVLWLISVFGRTGTNTADLDGNSLVNSLDYAKTVSLLEI
ncbi:DUF4214 domain-containing protein [Candidatus Roizmanbacteria bacterium]|nr:DUF4214 domain-containing protein [Candidatus Roizmanbacteria bacterium]